MNQNFRAIESENEIFEGRKLPEKETLQFATYERKSKA